MKKIAKKAAPEVGATEFKAHCLQLMTAVHDRKLNSVTVTKRGKPFVKLVPVPEEPNMVYGCLAGLAKVVGDLLDGLSDTHLLFWAVAWPRGDGYAQRPHQRDHTPRRRENCW